MPKKSTPEFFAYNQYRDYVIYKELAKVERVEEFKRILEGLVVQEFSDYEFWSKYSERKNFKVRRVDVLFYKLLRKFFGLTFTAKFLEGREREMIKRYCAYIETVDDTEAREKMQEIIEHEQEHEAFFISQVKEEQVEFMSNIVLGLNDGLIELTGALTGFVFALRDSALVAGAGFITGLSAALSMAASAYMQAQYEEGKQPKKAAAYTGVTYFIVVVFLVLPFIFFSETFTALAITLLFAVTIISAVSFYTSVLFRRFFLRQFSTMIVFSLGVAVIAFLFGFLFRVLSGVGI